VRDVTQREEPQCSAHTRIKAPQRVVVTREGAPSLAHHAMPGIREPLLRLLKPRHPRATVEGRNSKPSPETQMRNPTPCWSENWARLDDYIFNDIFGAFEDGDPREARRRMRKTSFEEWLEMNDYDMSIWEFAH